MILGIDPDGHGAAVVRGPGGAVPWWSWWALAGAGRGPLRGANFAARGAAVVRMPDLVDVGMAIAVAIQPYGVRGIVVEGLFALNSDSLVLAGRKALILAGLRRGGFDAPILAEPLAVDRRSGNGWRKVVLGLPELRADRAEAFAIETMLAAGVMPCGIPSARAQGAVAEAWCMAAYPERLAERGAA